ncbi:MAG: hypothetical protein QM726_18290 [Chitinophagaceae bacterium]
MTTNNNSSNFSLPLPLVLVFCISTAILLLAKTQLEAWNINTKVAIGGNMLLFAVTIASYLLHKRAMLHPTTTGFLGNTYSSTFLKLIVFIAALALYKFSAGELVNKPAVFICVFLYVVYAVLEVRTLMQWNKARQNA